MFGGDDDPVSRLAGPLASLVQSVDALRSGSESSEIAVSLKKLHDALVRQQQLQAKQMKESSDHLAQTHEHLKSQQASQAQQLKRLAAAPAVPRPTGNPADTPLKDALAALKQANVEVQLVGDLAASPRRSNTSSPSSKRRSSRS